MNFLVNSLYELLKIIACCCRYCRMDLFCHFCNCHIHWRVLGFSDFLFRISNVTRLWVQPTECASQNFCDAEAIGFDFDVQKDALAFEMLWPMLWPMLWGFCTFKTWFPSWKFFRIHICELDIGGLCLKSWQIWPWAKMASRNSHLVRWAVRTWKWTWELWSIEGTAWRIAFSSRGSYVESGCVFAGIVGNRPTSDPRALPASFFGKSQRNLGSLGRWSTGSTV